MKVKTRIKHLGQLSGVLWPGCKYRTLSPAWSDKAQAYMVLLVGLGPTHETRLSTQQQNSDPMSKVWFWTLALNSLI